MQRIIDGRPGLQASLPVHNGGLGLRCVLSLAPSAFLASTVGTRRLQDLILHRINLANDDVYNSCLTTRISSGTQFSDDSDNHKQRMWDKAVADAEYMQLMSKYKKPCHTARLLALAAQWRLASYSPNHCMWFPPRGQHRLCCRWSPAWL